MEFADVKQNLVSVVLYAELVAWNDVHFLIAPRMKMGNNKEPNVEIVGVVAVVVRI